MKLRAKIVCVGVISVITMSVSIIMPVYGMGMQDVMSRDEFEIFMRQSDKQIRAHVNEKNRSGYSPFLLAAMYDKEEDMSRLIVCGAHINFGVLRMVARRGYVSVLHAVAEHKTLVSDQGCAGWWDELRGDCKGDSALLSEVEAIYGNQQPAKRYVNKLEEEKKTSEQAAEQLDAKQVAFIGKRALIMAMLLVGYVMAK